jgi:[acyl-carrier-protein] S-malonyltransferase
MGKEIADAYPGARHLFEHADELLGVSLSSLCFDGPEDVLNDTYNAQPALYVCGMAALQALKSELADAKPAAVAGHSLGEFTALAAAGALSFEDGLRLVRERGRLMKEAGERYPGAMAALLGLDADAVRAVCADAAQHTGGKLVLANDNCPGQLVISGDHAALDRGLVLAKEAGAKRAVKLAVSIASHSPLMEPIAEEFRRVLAETTFVTPQVRVYGNVNAALLTSPEEIREELGLQLTHSVRWTESVRAMIAAGIEQFIELGPKDVLSGLLRRIDSTRTAFPINNLQTLSQFVQNH